MQDQNWHVPRKETKCEGITGDRGGRCLLVPSAYVNSATGDRRGGAECRLSCTRETSGMLKQGHGETSEETHTQEVTNIWKEPMT